MKRTTIDRSSATSRYSERNQSFARLWFGRLKLHLYYSKYFELIRRYLGTDEKIDLIDIGCGPGQFIRYIQGRSHTINACGVDADCRLIEEAKENVLSGTRLYCQNAEELRLDTDSFDAIVSFHMIEHLLDPDIFIRLTYSMLKDKGVLVLAMPNPEGIGAKIMGNKWQGYRDDHVSLRTINQWQNSLRQAGYQIKSTKTTFLSGVPIFNKLPFGVINWLVLAIFGSFGWKKGEAIIIVATKESTK